MADYMSTFDDKDVSIPLNLTGCEAALKKHLGGVLVESAWEDPAAIVFQVRWVLNHLSNDEFGDMFICASTVPAEAQMQAEFLEKCRKTFDISFVRLLLPAAQADIAGVMCALHRAMLALAHLNLDAICHDEQQKAPGYHPYRYSEAEIAECNAILSVYLDAVQSVSVRNNPARIMAAVQKTIESLNELNDRCGGSLIETDGREDICELIQCAAIGAGLNCADEDITEEWRDW